MIPFEWIEAASARINGMIRQTPLTFDSNLNAFFKWENHQITGSFKLRGAANCVLSLQPWEIENGLVTCSAGNHGQGVALAASQIGTKCIVFASSHAVPAKLKAMEKLGAEIRLVEGGYEEAERNAIEFSDSERCTFISPYNNAQVIAGQGTIGLELQKQTNELADVNNILVPMGGGGLICGIGASMEKLKNKPHLIGVQSESSAYFHAIYYLGSQDGVIEKDSIADGLAGRVEDDSITIPIVKHLVDDIVLVSENAIRQAIAYAWNHYNEVIEGSAAVTLAAILEGKIKNNPVLLIMSGGNIQPELHEKILNENISI